jgi:hypothetical protein
MNKREILSALLAFALGFALCGTVISLGVHLGVVQWNGSVLTFARLWKRRDVPVFLAHGTQQLVERLGRNAILVAARGGCDRLLSRFSCIGT